MSQAYYPSTNANTNTNQSVKKQNTEIVYLPVDRIAPNPYQPRRVFNKEALLELSESIREYGVMQPVTVRIINGMFYELVAGERRLRAAKLAGLSIIPAIIVRLTDRDSAVLALIENLQRENLNYFDEAEGLKSLIDAYGLTQDEIAKKIGKSQSTVANKIRILKLPRETQRLLLENDLSERHARALLKLPQNNEALLKATLEKVIAGNLTVKATENLVENIIKMDEKKNLGAEKPAKQTVKAYFKDMRIFKNTIIQAVDMMNGSGIDTVYDFQETGEGCFINIKITYK